MPTGLTSASNLTYQSMPTGFYDSLFIILVNPGKGLDRKVEFGFGGTAAHNCIAAYSKDYSLASNLQAKQQGLAFQQSYSSE